MDSRPQLVVFDLDGTLIDSSLDLCNSVNAALAHVGQPALPNNLIASYIGDGAAMLVRRALGDPGDLDSGAGSQHTFERAFDFFLAFYREHKLDNTRLYDGVLDALASIREAAPQLPMAVLTNKPVIPAREICAALGVSQFFFAIHGGNSFPTKKPDPEGLLHVIAEASQHTAPSIDAARVWMVGDSDVDVLTARRAGARSLGCTFGLAPHALALAAPDRNADHPSEWPAALGL